MYVSSGQSPESELSKYEQFLTSNPRNDDEGKLSLEKEGKPSDVE